MSSLTQPKTSRRSLTEDTEEAEPRTRNIFFCLIQWKTINYGVRREIEASSHHLLSSSSLAIHLIDFDVVFCRDRESWFTLTLTFLHISSLICPSFSSFLLSFILLHAFTSWWSATHVHFGFNENSIKTAWFHFLFLMIDSLSFTWFVRLSISYIFWQQKIRLNSLLMDVPSFYLYLIGVILCVSHVDRS